jgi:hypothetical protein
MPGTQKMTALQPNKDLLLLESTLNRLLLRAGCRDLREYATGMGRIRDGRRPIARWAVALVPLAGLVVALRSRRFWPGAGFLAQALAVVAPSLIPLGRALAASPGKSK